MAETEKKWYVLRAVSGKEAKVKEYLEAAMKHHPVLAANVGQVILPTEKYAPVRQSEVNRILGNAEESAVETAEMAIPFSVDETVKVTEGPFSGFSGVIEEVNAEKHKLKVMVKIFGRKTPLELAYSQVEKE